VIIAQLEKRMMIFQIFEIKQKTAHDRTVCASPPVVYAYSGRVESGGCPPGTSTDPDALNFRTTGTRHPVPLVKVSPSYKLIRFRYPPLFR
jgi:hypothetical protein